MIKGAASLRPRASRLNDDGTAARRVRRRCFAAIALAGVFSGEVALAQPQPALSLHVRETAGIRRGVDPVNARVPFPAGALRDPAQVRLMLEGKEVAAQVAPESRWPDDSIRWLAVDFNASIGPLEQNEYRLEYGEGVARAAPSGGLVVSEDAESIQVSLLRFGRSASPLILSANYRQEFIAPGEGGFVVVDLAGASHRLKCDPPGRVEILKRGPLYVVLRYTGRISVAAGYEVPFVITLEMPNTKSWVKYIAEIEDPQNRLREIALLTPMAFAAFPWPWDFGTGSWSYGTLRRREDSVMLVQETGAGAAGWKILAGPKGREQPREIAAGARPVQAEGWAHLQAGSKVIALAVEHFGREAGAHTIAFDGQGLVALRFVPAARAGRLRLAAYHHYVASPTPIGAGTGPVAMLHPPVAFCDCGHYVASGAAPPPGAIDRRE